jgi:hypothetical protein
MNQPALRAHEKAYAGVGSRETPEDVLIEMRQAARELGRQGWRLRSGGAPGADTAFEQGSEGFLQDIYLPWASFNPKTKNPILAKKLSTYAQAVEIAKAHHPMGHVPNVWARIESLMARNVMQVLGRNLDSPAKFLLCWGKKSKFDDQGRVIDVDGGTGLAVRLAATYGVTVYNMALPEHRVRIQAFLARLANEAVKETLTEGLASSTHAAERPKPSI